MGSSPSSPTSVPHQVLYSPSDDSDDLRTYRRRNSLKEASRQRAGSLGRRLTRALQTSSRRIYYEQDGDRAAIIGKMSGREVRNEHGDEESERTNTDHDVFILHQGWKKETAIAQIIAECLWQSKHKLHTICFSIDAISYFPEDNGTNAKSDTEEGYSLVNKGSPSSVGTLSGKRKEGKKRQSLREKRKDDTSQQLPPMPDILDMLENSKVFVIVLSEPLLENEFLHRLAAWAFVQGVRIVPLSCHGQAQVRSKLKLGTKLVLSLYEWFFASPDEHATKYGSVRKFILKACAQVQRANPSAMRREGGFCIRSSGNESEDLVIPHTQDSVDEVPYKLNPGIEHSPASCSCSAATCQMSFDFWDKCISATLTQQGQANHVSWDILHQALLTHYAPSFEILCNDEEERLKVLELIREQLCGCSTELTRQECMTFMEINCKGIDSLSQPPVDKWWSALLRSITLHSCLEYV